MKFRTSAVAALIAASVFATHTHAQAINDSFTYQGTLQDGGVPANGLYDITFLVYTDEVGGSVVTGGIHTVQNVPVVNGLFTTEVDFGVSGLVFDSDDTRWLELRVSLAGQPGTTILAPRTKLTPAALANYALRSGFAATSGTTLQQAYENSNAITLEDTFGPIELYSTVSQEARFDLYSTLANLRTTLGVNFLRDAGYLNIYGPLNQTVGRLELDVSPGGGGFLTVARNNDGVQGITLEGNVNSTQNARLRVFGDSEFIEFDTNSFGNGTVTVPVDAISSTEILNEVGAAESASIGLVNLTDDSITVDTIDSVTINAPTPGFVLLLATAEVTVNHVTGSISSVNFGVSNIPNGFSSNTDIEIRINSSVLSGAFDYPFTSHAIYPVSTGANTFYFNGDDNTTGGATISLLDRQLSAIFIPTSYGSLARHQGNNAPDEMSPGELPMNAYDIIAEQNAALHADNARQQREIDEMRAMMNEMRQQLNNNQRD